MNYTIEQIEQLTGEIHTAINANDTTTVNVIDLANQLGYSVYESKFNNSDIDGMVRSSSKEKAIYINKNNMPERNRFTIAHELGHIILHHHSDNDDGEFVDYRGNNNKYDPKEHEANMFAASLLMPKHTAENVWRSINDVDDFANIFKVSRAAASIRLQNLGLI
jgi:Zn-dependent peptidase ImmA (M78 family)